MNYKDTLLTPNTEFEMKANLPTKEPLLQEKWRTLNVAQLSNAKNRDKPQFLLHDGPPYANGNLHVGHALNKILKDFIVRYQNLKGNYSPFICGWDTHGLPIETAVANQGVDRKAVSPVEFREICAQYAAGQINNQINQLNKLGLLTDFDDKYVTLTLDYELGQLELFKKMVVDDLIYRDLKPIYWSCSSESALAEAEIEYEELTSPSIYVTFDVVTSKELPVGTKIVIWTTTPWTIPMNQLLAVGAEIEYVLVTVAEQGYLVAKNLLESLTITLGWENPTVVKTYYGNDLVGTITAHPLYQRETTVVLGHHVTTEAGTGIVHIASGFGEDDYLIARQNNIKVYAPLNNEGKYTTAINDDQLVGLFYENANKLIGERLAANNQLLKLKFIKHKHPIDWRTKKPVIYRATDQWFVAINKIKPALLTEISQVNWFPEWGEKRIANMIANRQDWCISRQRLWGVPIIVFYDENNVPQVNAEIIEHVINLFKVNQTTNIWFSWSADELLPASYQNKNFKKEQDIMDVWFDSGSSNLNVIKNRGYNHPVELYLEGVDQFRGWFNSSLITSVIATGHAPYRNVVAHGFVNDEKGRKMSKSLGNIISPLEIAEQYGADVLRMWVASVDYQDDVKIGPDIIKQSAEAYRKIRNTLRFMLANLADFDASKDFSANLSEVDKYVLHLTKEFQAKVIKGYESLNFNTVFTLINNFVITTLSKFYLDFIKDILYIEKANAPRRRAVQTTLYQIYRVLIDVLKPIIPHTTEETHQFINYPDKASSIHLEDNYVLNCEVSPEIINRWNKVLKLRDDINKELEVCREQKIINKSLECQVTIALKPEYQELAAISDLHQIFIVSGVNFTDDKTNLREYETSYLQVQPKNGSKCERCWMIVDKLAANNEICLRCFDILN
ncbi:isoleucyl-tRNA synthetase [Spiroplasma syrphidicola EA-1]|uniref:Isoleucine--tRNA ligase n=1 Tax=Spiroplasma syrphidicola EA-1 TaxID=1276229 RepID=R4UJF2_9MOLU|nr:isoleucine--tRNA ligase [Spiroplasma syrphidicola]AGM26260.1 isoleucyl-tRNA synthetase [Spiroplasma syrphidicola EA-1]